MLYVRFCGAGGAAGAARIVPTIGSSPRARGTVHLGQWQSIQRPVHPRARGERG